MPYTRKQLAKFAVISFIINFIAAQIGFPQSVLINIGCALVGTAFILGLYGLSLWIMRP